MIFESEADWKAGMQMAIVQGLIDAIYFWGSSRRYVIINPELVRLIQKCGWQKLVSAVSHGKSAKVKEWFLKVKEWFLKQYQDQDTVYGWSWLDNNKVEIERGDIVITDAGYEQF